MIWSWLLIFPDLPRQRGSPASVAAWVPVPEKTPWQSQRPDRRQQKILNFHEIRFSKIIHHYYKTISYHFEIKSSGNKKIFLFSKVYFYKHWKELNLTTYPTQLNVFFSHNLVFLRGNVLFLWSLSLYTTFPLYTLLALLFPIKRRLFTAWSS